MKHTEGQDESNLNTHSCSKNVTSTAMFLLQKIVPKLTFPRRMPFAIFEIAKTEFVKMVTTYDTEIEITCYLRICQCEYGQSKTHQNGSIEVKHSKSLPLY